MTLSIKTVLYLVSLVAFALAAAGVSTGRLGLLGLGLFAWEAAAVLV